MKFDVADAETLVREIAAELVELPMDPEVQTLHVKLLASRRVIARWSEHAPPPEEVAEILDALRVLYADVLNRRSVSSVRIARSALRQRKKTVP